MAQYYGIQRSEEYLAHYGVRGMKWGVRKAIERGDRAGIRKQYAKAKKKLEKLDDMAKTGKGIRGRRIAAGTIMSGLGSAAGSYALNRLSGVSRNRSALAALTGGVAGASLGAIANGHAPTASERINAQAARNNWAREMNAAFKGTGMKKVSVSGNSGSKKRRRR